MSELDHEDVAFCDSEAVGSFLRTEIINGVIKVVGQFGATFQTDFRTFINVDLTEIGKE